MNKVIHESKPARYVVQYRHNFFDEGEWNDLTSFHRQEDAVKCSDENQRAEPGSQYRVIDTKED